jgi:hypothetical protein
MKLTESHESYAEEKLERNLISASASLQTSAAVAASEPVCLLNVAASNLKSPQPI